MKEKKLIKKIRLIGNKITPNNYPVIAANLPSEKKKTKSWLLIPVTVILGLTIINFYSYYQSSQVIIDVNPSILMKVNRQNKIIEIKPLNHSGAKIVKAIDLNHPKLKNGINVLINLLVSNGYLSNEKNSILLTTDDAKVEAQIIDIIAKTLETKKIKTSIIMQKSTIDENIKKIAQENNISESKAQFIKNIVKNKPLYTIQDLKDISINELNLLSNPNKHSYDNIKIKGNASEAGYVGKEKAKAIALNHAKVTAKEITGLEIEFDYVNQKLVYEVEFDVHGIEYDYEIDSQDGKIIKYEIESQINHDSQATAKSQAFEVALEHSKLSRQDIIETEINYKHQKGCAIYEIEFETQDYEYEYYIDSRTLKILSFEKEKNRQVNSKQSKREATQKKRKLDAEYERREEELEEEYERQKEELETKSKETE